MKWPLIALTILTLALAGGFYVWYTSGDGEEEVACTLEAKLCPDGSAVGRTGPNCEFAECPGEE
ncbi:MAG: hypothetical protein WD850_02890 [Candidatus Spechtbacterales bacterium]